MKKSLESATLMYCCRKDGELLMKHGHSTVSNIIIMFRLRTESMLYQQEEDVLITLDSQFEQLRKYLSVWVLDTHMTSLKGKVDEDLLYEAIETCRPEVESEGLSCHILHQLTAMGELLENKGGVDLTEVCLMKDI